MSCLQMINICTFNEVIDDNSELKIFANFNKAINKADTKGK